MSETVTLYGMQASLYTGKVRAYLRRNRFPVIERGAGHPDFHAHILPRIGGRFIMPVVELPDGEILQDGTDILDWFDARGHSEAPLHPVDPVLRAISHLFELFGNEGLLRPAMHYRWNFYDDNLAFLKVAFEDVLPAGGADMFDYASGRMRKAGRAFGVTDETIPTIEASYLEFLDLFEAHLAGTYYLLGGQPTTGDYALFNPLFAHLARDPHPSMIMKTRAPRVFAWVERMNRPEVSQPHAMANAPEGLFSADDLPETLIALMRYVGEDYGAEISAHISYANQWLRDNPTIETPDRVIGLAPFQWRGHTIKTAVMLYRFYLLQRLQDHAENLSTGDAQRVSILFGELGLSDFLTRKPARRVLRRDYHEVWESA